MWEEKKNNKKKKTKKLQVHPHNPVSWLLTHQGILSKRIFKTIFIYFKLWNLNVAVFSGYVAMLCFCGGNEHIIYSALLSCIEHCFTKTKFYTCIGVLVFYSWVSNGVIGFHYPVSSKENCREAQSSITQYTTSIAISAAWLSWWCSGYHSQLLCGGRGFKSHSGQIFFLTFTLIYIVFLNFWAR